jgi:hypothetical protein
MVHRWVSDFFFDFDDKMVGILENFVNNVLPGKGFEGAAKELKEAMKGVSCEQFFS